MNEAHDHRVIRRHLQRYGDKLRLRGGCLGIPGKGLLTTRRRGGFYSPHREVRSQDECPAENKALINAFTVDIRAQYSILLLCGLLFGPLFGPVEGGSAQW